MCKRAKSIFWSGQKDVSALEKPSGIAFKLAAESNIIAREWERESFG